MAAKHAGGWQIQPACSSFHLGHRSANTLPDSLTNSSELLDRGRFLQGCIKLLDFPLLGPLPTRSSRGEDGELDAALGSLDPPGLTSFRCNETPFWSPRPGQSTDFTVCLQTRLAPKGCSAGNHASPRNIFSHYANISEFKRI